MMKLLENWIRMLLDSILNSMTCLYQMKRKKLLHQFLLASKTNFQTKKI